MKPTPPAVAAALAAHRLQEIPALPGQRNHLPAGVLVPLVFGEDGVQVLLTLRTGDLRHHAGQVSFPGGKPEPGDADLWATAAREAREEIGVLAPTLLGRLSAMPVYTSDYRLHPFVAAVPDDALRPDPGEVARLLRVDIEGLLSAEVIEAIPFQWLGRQWLSPLWALDDEVLLFGGTAHTLLELLQVVAPVFGRAVPPLRDTGRRWPEILG